MGPSVIRKSFLIAAIFLTVHFKIALADYQGSLFSDIRSRVFAEPYRQLPVYKINRDNFGRSGDRPDNHVLQAGRRALTEPADLYDFPGGQKLFQANGICFAGEWIIDGTSAFTGQFSRGTRTPVIARASVALDGTEQRHKRAFAMAIKLFPGSDKNTPAKTLNLFVMHSLGGVRVKHVLDLALDNAPSLGSLPPLRQLRTALRLRRDFERADRQISKTEPDVAFRPVGQLAEVPAGGQVVAPTWVRLRASESLPRIDRADFRDELRTEHYPGHRLVWQIDAASGERGAKQRADWQTLGRLVLHESVTSPFCDRRLHFTHPRLTPN